MMSDRWMESRLLIESESLIHLIFSSNFHLDSGYVNMIYRFLLTSNVLMVFQTPLHWSAYKDYKVCVEILLQGGADRTLKNVRFLLQKKIQMRKKLYDEMREKINFLRNTIKCLWNFLRRMRSFFMNLCKIYSNSSPSVWLSIFSHFAGFSIRERYSHSLFWMKKGKWEREAKMRSTNDRNTENSWVDIEIVLIHSEIIFGRHLQAEQEEGKIWRLVTWLTIFK